MTCKHAQSILVGKKYVKKNYLKPFLGGQGINIMLSYCNFLHTKRKKTHNLIQFTLRAKYWWPNLVQPSQTTKIAQV